MAVQVFPVKIVDERPADEAFASEAIDVSNHPWASFQVNAAGLTGTLDGTVELQTTCVPTPEETDWITKHDLNGDPIKVTLDAASVTELYSLNGVVGEPKARIKLTPNGLSGGTVTVWFNAKSGGR